MAFRLRPSQAELVDLYLARHGRLGVSAVPGSGKTHTLSYLAARLAASGLDDDQEVLIVTLVNAAVENFRQRIAGFMGELGLLPGMGYRVRTLHGLAHDIVRQRPGLVGLSDDFVIVDERQSGRLLEDAVNHWLQDHPHAGDEYLALDELSEQWLARVRRRYWPELVLDLARSFIKRAKDWRVPHEVLAQQLAAAGRELPLAAMALDIYRDYQSNLSQGGAVDFDDLIRLAYQTLSTDPAFLARLRRQWPFILEDEAQDSSQSQEDILRLLADHPAGNWVRVGDPNQAVYHTFTNASPEYLRRFLVEPGVSRWELPESGRSQPGIIRLANRVMDWTQQEHPVPELRGTLLPPHIEPTPPGDPQPNPADDPTQIHLVSRAYTPERELEDVVRSVQHWLSTHPESGGETVAVLVPANRRGAEMADALRRRGVRTVELLDTTPATRSAVEVLGHIVQHLSQPAQGARLAAAFQAWQRADWDVAEQAARLRAIKSWLNRLRWPEAFLWPEPGQAGWEGAPPDVQDDPEAIALLVAFRAIVRRWQAAAALPVDQLVLTVAQDLFRTATDLALGYKLAVELRHQQALHPDWRLPELAEELSAIARNERRFLGFTEAAYVAKPGEVTVATMHRAKGLEWDRVYLTSVNTYDFPSCQPDDTYRSERWFVRDRLNLEAEALEQLTTLHNGNVQEYAEGQARFRARADYAAERLCLFYVGITRAKKELVITWNQGRQGENQPPRQQALSFVALAEWWNQENSLQEGS